MLKIIAVILMLIDHIGVLFFPGQLGWRYIGRLAMPIFACGIAEGLYYTSFLKGYIRRMALFAVVSQIPFWMMVDGTPYITFRWGDLNIGFTFLLTLIIFACLKQAKISGVLERSLYIFMAFLMLILSDLFRCDYGSFGILTVGIFYYFYIKEKSLIKSAIAWCILTILNYGGLTQGFYLEIWGLAGFIIIYYFKNRSHQVMKGFRYFFYIFYPLHMLVLSLIRWGMSL